MGKPVANKAGEKQEEQTVVSPGLWPALKANLRQQKHALTLLQRPAFRILALTSLLPILVLSIRWKSLTVQSSDDSRLGVFLTKATGHSLHGLFFVIALWIGLDPDFSPRNLATLRCSGSFSTCRASIFSLSSTVFPLWPW